MPLRIVKPWLLLDWIYKLTETASAELDQKRKLDDFTRKVKNLVTFQLNRKIPILFSFCKHSIEDDKYTS